MRLGVVTQFDAEHGVGRLVAKTGGPVVGFLREDCDAEPRQGSLVRFEAVRQKRGAPIASKVLLVNHSGVADTKEVNAVRPPHLQLEGPQ